MTKHYFVAYQGHDKKGNLISGHTLIRATDASLNGISKYIASANDLDGDVVVTCLKDLSKKEYEMLKGE